MGRGIFPCLTKEDRRVIISLLAIWSVVLLDPVGRVLPAVPVDFLPQCTAVRGGTGGGEAGWFCYGWSSLQ